MEKLFELHTEGRFDLLVLDTPPTRNALDFLDAPKRLTQFIEGRSLRVFMKPTGLAAKVAGRGASVALGVFKRIVGFDLLADLAEFFNAFSGMVDGFQARAKRVNSCSPTPTPASSSSAARRASRSTRPSTSTASWSRRSCPSAASSSTRSTTRPSSCAATATTCRRRWPRSSATRTWPSGSPTNFADYQALAERDARNIERLAQRAAQPRA